MFLPEKVRRVVDFYLARCEEQVPGVVEGLYLGGSLGFGEWYDGRSDVDFMAVTTARPDAGTLAALRGVHERVADLVASPYSDGLYATWGDLGRLPAECRDLPCIFQGQWSDARSCASVVTWHELAHHAVHMRVRSNARPRHIAFGRRRRHRERPQPGRRRGLDFL